MKEEVLERELYLLVNSCEAIRQAESWIADHLPRLAPNEEILLRGKLHSETAQFRAAVLSRFVGEVPRFLLYEAIEQHNHPNKEVDIEAVLHMPLQRLVMYLARQLSERDFFGNFKPALQDLLQTLELTIWKPALPRRRIRRRGYRDKGNLRPEHRWLPAPQDHKQQEEIEQERFCRQMEIFFFTGEFVGT